MESGTSSFFKIQTIFQNFERFFIGSFPKAKNASGWIANSRKNHLTYLRIVLRVKNLFFDRQVVIDAIGKSAAASLSKIGAFLRTRAKSSMPKRKAPAAPGMPPSRHEGSLARFLFFSWDPGSRSIVVGPEKLDKPGDVPRLMEFGGTVDRKSKHGTRLLNYRPHPYMGPALDAEIKAGTMPQAFRGSLRH
jgi:hypothetical protein